MTTCPHCFRPADTDATTPVKYGEHWTPSFVICCFCGGLRGVIEAPVEEAS